MAFIGIGRGGAASLGPEATKADKYTLALRHSCEEGDLAEMNAVLAQLAAARAAEEGCSEAEATRNIILESCADGMTATPLSYVMIRRRGGDGPDGWIGQVRRLFEAVGDDGAALLATAVNAPGRMTTLHFAVTVPPPRKLPGSTWEREPPKKMSRAAVALFLAYGADARIKNATERDPIAFVDLFLDRKKDRDTDLVALLELAARVGGPAAVARTLADTPHVLVDSPGWGVVRTMPRLLALDKLLCTPRASLPVIIAHWADARARWRDEEADVEGSVEYGVFARVPRAALAVTLKQLAREAAPPAEDSEDDGW
eukprot:CAMPEP_0203809844 /NCGR_PEP_ID=MMETSP0115-20131106/2570_1 /ASSEMBLY_ACC=CAM_ASM_000227 /TAXON_ID=33651 /ORGANISM="Bicosoecid sp, Strain ms1" /LENGTH=313 /DNA_ID=CAMNT_0050718607 /DNA_START=29 /DNA_END=967 /DNA_ORIENTATION=-